jgi:hypothetical protein
MEVLIQKWNYDHFPLILKCEKRYWNDNVKFILTIWKDNEIIKTIEKPTFLEAYEEIM